MNAPEAIAPPAAITTELPLAHLHPSKTNPRKHFDQVALDELANSIREHGICQPILVRPKAPDGFEIVAGERRYRAAKIAGLATAPVLVRDLTDVQTLELQVIENLQRADLHQLEEAEGYEQLMKLHKQTADELAAKVGKSRGYVYQRLKLLALSPASRKAFYEGALAPTVAVYIARIPGHDLQDKALKDVTAKDYRGEVFSARLAQEHIQRNFMLRLKEAPFATKDAKLVPKAGACGECPKRTGNQPELFQDVGSADVCTDPTCFSAKRTAHFAVIKAQAGARGQEVISGKAAKDIAPHGSVHGGYVRADGNTWLGNKQVDVAAALKKVKDVPVALLEMPGTHELVAVVEEKALAAAMRKAGLIKTEPRASSSSAKRSAIPSGPSAADIEDLVRWRVIDGIRGRLTADGATVSLADGALVARVLWDSMVSGAASCDRLAIAYGWIDPPKDAKGKPGAKEYAIGYETLRRIPDERFASLSAAEMWRVLIDLALASLVDDDYSDKSTEPKPLYETADRHGVDHKAIRTEIIAAEKAKLEEAKAAEKAKASAAKSKPTKKAKAP